MKYKQLFLTICSFICFLGITSFAYMQSNSTQKLKLTVNTSKKTYKLGEVIDFSLSLKNESNQTISFLDVFGTGTGYLKIQISQNGENFVDYDYPSWGSLDISGAETSLKPNESSEASANILWKWLGDNPSKFIFSNLGVYYIKARYSTIIEGEGDNLMKSEPIQIIITEPVGEDLEVWNKIKDDGEFAYFIQEGDIHIPSYKTDEREKFLDKVEQIINQYPNSFYAESLRQSLTKFRADEVERQEFLQKLKPKQPQ